MKINHFIDMLVFSFSCMLIPALIGLLSLSLFITVVYLFPDITLFTLIGLLALTLISDYLARNKKW